MRFRCQMHHVSDCVLLDYAQDRRFIAQVHFLKDIFGTLRDPLQVGGMPGVSKAIQIYQPFDFRALNDVLDQIRADESCAARDK